MASWPSSLLPCCGIEWTALRERYPYLSVFSPNTEKYGPEYGHFSRSARIASGKTGTFENP